MARRQFVTRAPLRQGQRRQFVWFGISVVRTALPGNAKVLLATLNAVALALRPFTVVRSRITLQVESDQSAASEFAHGAFGHIVVSDQAIAAGSASVPGPVLATDAPFFVYEPFIHSFVVISAIGVEEPAGTVIEVDSKAMRKVGNNEDLAFMVQSTSTSQGSIVSVQGRYLVKLH